MFLKTSALRKFFAMPRKDQRILMKAFFRLSIIRVGLWLLPFKILQQILERLFRYSFISNKKSLSPEKVSWAVRAVSRYVPSATCLAQALTLQTLLLQEGITSDLAIGVARDDESGIIAHAWLEVDGTVIIGGEVRDGYTQLK